MKITINYLPECENEVILNYSELTPEVNRVMHFLQNKSTTLIGREENEIICINVDDVLYIETVDAKTFAYTQKSVVRLDLSLVSLIDTLDDIRFFRCSKSMIINIAKIECLKSLPSNRIDATILGGEHVIISRRYASELRKILKGGRKNEK